MDMALQKELQVCLHLKTLRTPLFSKTLLGYALKTLEINILFQKKGRKRKLREDEMVSPTSKPVYKWRAERKR